MRTFLGGFLSALLIMSALMLRQQMQLQEEGHNLLPASLLNVSADEIMLQLQAWQPPLVPPPPPPSGNVCDGQDPTRST